MTSSRGQLIALIEQGAIPEDKVDRALAVAGVKPDARTWLRFLDRLLLIVGGLAIAVSVVFFIAYNWADLGRFAKFGLVEALMIAAAFGYWKLGAETIGGKVALLGCTILLGVLMALYGQTYQTGADPWQLFFNWALLMLPWALLGRFPAIWIIWLALVNLSIVLYFQTFPGIFGFVLGSPADVLWLLSGFNVATLLAWEWLARRRTWLNRRWALRLIALAGGSAITCLVLWSIFDVDEVGWAPIVAWLAWTAGLFRLYKTILRDLFMLAGLCLSGIVIASAFLVKAMLDLGGGGGYLVIAIAIVGMATAAAAWLRNVNREWRQ